ncbi:alpha/beta-hydrolase [Russula earlei]|uniref:Alpha/beta-hydrolase n=1 Tax=Russula earlei TaxID=71964 RepID=A0ACC0UHC6_9AGAM|nr:alpha/beta-hydrolase [Russula earlei]
MATSTESTSDSWYTDLSSIPAYASARFLSDKIVQVASSSQDHTRNAKRTTSKTFFVKSNRSDGTFTVIASPAQDVSPEVIASAISPSGKLTAILRETNSGDKRRFVEIWEGERLEAAINVTKAHGVFYKDDQLSTLAFSPSETSLVYTAEANAPENQGDDPFSKFRFLPDYGEGYVGRKRPTLFVARWVPNAETVDVLSGGHRRTVVQGICVPKTMCNSEISFGQAQFLADDRLLATSYEYTEDGKRLGIRACFNRPTAIWELKLALEVVALEQSDTLIAISATKISDPRRASCSPRPIPGSSAVLWLSHELGGPHASCFSLHKFDLQAREATTHIPVIDKIQDDFMDGFAGLYTETFLARPFVRLGGRVYLLTRTSQCSRLEVILVDLEQPETVIQLTPAESGEDLWSWSPLATDSRKWVLASRSAPTVPNELVLGRLEEHGGRPKVTWQVIEMPSLTPRVESALRELRATVVPIQDRYPVETVLIEPKRRRGQPLMTVIHGGPHGHVPTAFNPSLAAYALQGYTLNVPNYTGSTGFGDIYVQELIGKCGSLDVEDVKATVDHLVREGKGEHGPGKQFVTGGSHGGFLTAHLIGQYPDTFSAAVLRNPVICSQPASTDIPDWYFFEFGVRPSTESEQMTPALYAQLYPSSPIAHVRNVKAPVLLLLGVEDRRVVNVQGKTFFHALRGLGKKVELLMFEGEGHALDGVEAARVGWDVTIDWFDKAV